MVVKNTASRVSLEEIRNTISELQNIDLRNADVDDLKKKLAILFQGYVIQTPLFKAGLKLYRGILCNDKPQNRRDVSYPPAQKCKKHGRVNRPWESIFYCSLSEEPAFFELNPKLGDKIAVSHWLTKDKLFVHNVGYSIVAFEAMGSDRENQYPFGSGSIKPNELEEENVFVRDFFNKEFTRRIDNDHDYLYKLSIAIAEISIREEKFGGLLYPTIAMRANSDNIALKTEYVDRSLVLEKVEFYKITEVGNFEYQRELVDLATDFEDDGKINWKRAQLEQRIIGDDVEIKVSVESDKLVARNLRGKIVGIF